MSGAWRAIGAGIGRIAGEGTLKLWAVILGTMALTAAEAGLVMLIWRGGWPPDLAARQLDAIAFIAFGALALIALGVASITMVSLRVTGPGGVSVEVGREPDGAGPAPTS